MTLEPAPPGAGSAPHQQPPPAPRPALDPPDPDPSAPFDDETRLRTSAQRHWMRRRDLERQLHDGAALRISALALRLGLLRHRRPDDEQELQDTIDDLQGELHEVLQELRKVAGSLYPPLLDEAGLGPALREVADRSPARVRIEAPDERFDAAVEGAAYFTLLGCLTGGATDPPEVCTDDHGAVRMIEVVIRRDGDALVAVVDGVEACHAASMHDGVRLLGGTVVVGPASLITVRIPCA